MMSAAELLAMLKEGGWGVAVLAILFAGWCLRGWHADKDGRLRDREEFAQHIIKLANEATTALMTSSQAYSSRASALEALSASILETGAAMKSLTATNDIQVDRVIDKLDQILRGQGRP